MFQNAARAASWDSVRNSDPKFASLPAFGTTEFKTMADKVRDNYPELAEMADSMRKAGNFHGDNAAKIYRLMAKVASGQQLSPEVARQLVATGQKNAQRAAQKRAAGNLGSGQSRSAGAQTSTGNSQFQTNQDIFDAETMERYHRDHGRL
jgi:hypothetical protein